MPFQSRGSRRSSALEDDPQGAYEAGLRFLAARPRSVAEVRWRLERRYSSLAVEAALFRLEEADLLGDETFVAYWIDQRETFSPRGVRALRAELAAKGVRADLISAALERIGVSEAELACRAAAKYVRRGPGSRRDRDARALAAHLARRGFRPESIRAATSLLTAEVGSGPADGLE